MDPITEFTTQLDPKMAKLAEFLYKDKFEKYTSPADFIPEEFDELRNDVDIILNMASRLLDMCRFQECWEITSKVMQTDPFNPYCLPIHISALKELDKTNELFEVAHKLMQVHPSSALSWFAVGTYYACIQKNELARRHLVKSSQLDRRFGPTWLALGHAFAADGEHDQAIASYCTASQVIKGSHIPIMYIAIEYSASNNRHLAERFLTQAYLLRPNDPFVLHELGTLAFESQKYCEAIDFLRRAHERACELSGQIPSSFWEPLINNMAHTYRKLGLYDKALSMHQAALRFVPDSPTTLAGIAMIYAMTGRLDEAVNCLHRVIGLQPGSSGTSSISVAGTMLELCIDLLYGKPSKETHKPGRDIPDSPPQKHLTPAGPGSLPGSHRVRFKKHSPDQSNASKSSANALHLDVIYRERTVDHTDPSLDTSDEDVTMDLS